MDVATRSERATRTLILLAAVGIVGLIGSRSLGPGTQAYAVAASVASAVSFVVAGVVIGSRGHQASPWPGARHVRTAFLMIGAAAMVIAVSGAFAEQTYEPHVADLLFLALLLPLLLACNDEFIAHFDERDRREVGSDVLLTAVSLAALFYLLVRPANADAEASVSAATFALLAAGVLTSFGALALWSPSAGHLLTFAGLGGLALATLQFGIDWTRGAGAAGNQWVDVAYIVLPVAIAAVYVMLPHEGAQQRAAGSTRIARPLLSSLAVVTAAAALSLIAILADTVGITGAHSIAIILILGASIALRIIANQLASSKAFQESQAALERREEALQDADAALERVRESAASLRASEEHLRLVFDAAVDGFVELDHEQRIERVNDAFARMVALDRGTIEGQPWSAFAASVEGANPAFRELPAGGQAMLERPDGQVLHVESSASQIPTDPPRVLLLIRDTTAAKVADQTIRSLFHFLQDRDEDRTRLLRRTNAAIETERNRVARDLHDGPVQGVSAASLSLEAALLMIKAGDTERGIDVLVKIRQELAEEADALRQLMSGLRPPVLEERGLMPALRETLARFGAETGITTQFDGTITRPVPRDVETLAYRVVQEALTNVGKHAEATRVSVVVESDATQLRVEIEDDGRGFETNQTRDYLRSGRVGLASMRERVELASGTFTLRSTPGRGTVVIATIPFESILIPAPP
jgi:PAS domain S-box-containing protein